MYQETEKCFLQSRQKLHKRHRSENFYDVVNDLFNKKFCFRFSKEWQLPQKDTWFTAPPWKIKDLESIKNKLNFYKSQLNDFNIEEWSSHTRRRNPAGEVCWKLKCVINPEFLTQAWTKFYECACTYDILQEKSVKEGKIVSLHLCEAPGAFITSFNHYLKIHHPEVEWDWLASTLNPYYEGNSPSNMISDDRFMFHTLDHWHFGEDNTGNIMDWSNSQSIIRRVKSMGKVLIVTADGSIDCLQKPDAQEEITSPLHYCEIVTGLQTLAAGGTFIFKLFTLFEHSTVCILYLINHLFSEVNIYKPVTSKQGNSEVYAICLNYVGYENIEQYVPILKSTYGIENYGKNALFPLEVIPENFINQIEECANYFCSIQCQVINDNLQAYLMQNNIAFHTDIKKIRCIVANEFINAYNLTPLTMEQEILKGLLHEESKMNTNPRYHRGSYTERQLYYKMSAREKCGSLKTLLYTDILSNHMIFLNETVRWLNMHDGTVDLSLKFTCGLPVQKINSSKFIFVPIFKLFQQIHNDEDFKDVTTLPNGNVDDKITNFNIDNCVNITLPYLNYKECYNDHEKKCFQIMLTSIKTLDLGYSLIVKNFDPLTHFNVSLLYLLSKKCFERIGFSSCNTIILNNFINKSSLSYLDIIEQECNKLLDRSVAVLNFLPVQITNVGDFFNNVIFYNNTFYKNRCIEYIDNIETSLAS